MSTDKGESLPLPNDPPSSPEQKQSGWFVNFLNVVERLGNLLPHPITLFAMFCAAVVVISGIAGYFELTVIDPRPEGASGRSADGLIHVVSLMNAEGLRMIVSNLVYQLHRLYPARYRACCTVRCWYCRTFRFAFCSYAFIGYGYIKAPCDPYHSICGHCV